MFSIKSFKLKHALFFSLGLHLMLLPALSLPNQDSPVIKPPKKKWETVRLDIKKKPEVQLVPKKEIQAKPSPKIIKPQIKPVEVAARPISKPVEIVKKTNPSPSVHAPQAIVPATAMNPVSKPEPIATPTLIQPKRTVPSSMSAHVVSAHAIPSVNHFTQAQTNSRAKLVRTVALSPNTNRGIAKPILSPTNNVPSQQARIVQASFNASSQSSHFITQPKHTYSNTSKNQNSVQKTQLITARGVTNVFTQIQAKTVGISKIINQGQNGHRPSNLIRGFEVASLSPKVEPRAMASIKTVQEETLSEDEFNMIWKEYASTILNKVKLVKKYPSLARQKEIEGRVVVAFQVDSKGTVKSLSINESSGHDILDTEALHAVEKAGPYNPIPVRLALQTMTIKIPISFVMR
jgi:TonB family protein